LLWAILKHVVAELLQETWNNISQDVIDRICTNFPHRLQLCLNAKGQSISKLLHLCGAREAADLWTIDNRVAVVWSAAEDPIIHEAVRTHDQRWTELAINNGWYAVIPKREHKVLGDRD
jgi:hypothetical protein